MSNTEGTIGGGTHTLTLARKGLRTAPGASGQADQDGLHEADNVVLNRDGLLEPRRGLDRAYLLESGDHFKRLALFRGELVSYSTSPVSQLDRGTLRLHSTVDGSVTKTYAMTVRKPTDGRVRTAESALSLFVRHADGVARLDSPAGELVPAGVEGGLDCDGSIVTTPGSDGVAIPGDCQVAYRACFGTRDANGRLILGAPSGRAVVQSAIVQVAVGGLTRTIPSTLVTATVPTGHGLVAGERVELFSTDANFQSGVYSIVNSGATTVTFNTVSNATATSTVATYFARTPRNVSVSASIPPGVASGSHFARFYRSPASVSYDSPPSDDMGLVAEVVVPGTSRVTSLARTLTTVTATTAAPHGLTAGSLVSLAGLPGAAAADVALSLGTTGIESVRSTNAGVNWGGAAPAGEWRSIAWAGGLSLFCGGGNNLLSTSPDGTTWTPRGSAVANRTWNKMAWGGGYLMALSSGAGTETRTCTITATSQVAEAEVSPYTEFLGVEPGAVVTAVLAHRRSAGSPSRNVSAHAQYRINGGSWVTLGTATRAATTQLYRESVGLGTLPQTNGGALDLRVSVECQSCSWLGPREVYDPDLREWVTVADTCIVTCEQVAMAGLSPVAQRSSDGSTWTQVTLPAGAWDALCHDGTRFVLVGHACTGAVPYLRSATSADGRSWAVGSTSGVSGVAQDCAGNGSGLTVAVGLNRLAYSITGTTWLTPAAAPTGAFLSVARGPTYFTAVGPSASLRTDGGSTYQTGSLTGNAYAVTADGSTMVAVGDTLALTSTDYGLTWTTRTISSGFYRAVASSPSTGIAGGSYTVVSTPATNQFTFTTVDSGAIGTTTVSQDALPLAVGLVDSVPDLLLSEAAYWNASQEGILASHDLPPDCLDMAVFGDRMLYASPQRRPVVLVTLLKVGTSGLQAGDTIDLPGGRLTAVSEASAESGYNFRVFTSGTDQLNIFRTAQGIVRVINRNARALQVTAVQTSDQNSPSAGGFAVISTDFRHAASFNATTAVTGAFSPAPSVSEEPRRQLNVISYSVAGMPDSVPTLNYETVGAADKEVLRVVPLRESCLVFKEDGLWKLRGTGPYTIEPVDLTLRLVAPDTAVTMRNACIALTNQGVVAVSETGIERLHQDIQDITDEILAPSMRDAVSTYSFGVAYESEAAYLMWYPGTAAETVPNKALVFHADSGEWTTRSDFRSHALVVPSEDRMWAVSYSEVFRERKDYAVTDWADETLDTALTITSQAANTLVLSSVAELGEGDVLVQGSLVACVLSVDYTASSVTVDRSIPFVTGTADLTALKGIITRVSWPARYVPQATHRQMRAREVALSFRSLHMSSGALVFSSDIVRGEQSLVLYGSYLGLSKVSDIVQPRVVRALVTRDHSRCARLLITWLHQAGYAPFQLDSMTLTYSHGSERVSR